MNKSLLSSNRLDWETPQDFFDQLNEEFNFDLDPCSSDENHKCILYYTKEQDGLKQDWGDHTVFCNPPYGREIAKWVEKCANHRGVSVMLIPARTDTKYFHKWIYQKNNVEIRFIPGRLKFGNSKNSAPFPSMVVVFRNRLKNLTHDDFHQVAIHLPNADIIGGLMSGSMTITKDDPQHKRLNDAFEKETQCICEIERKLHDILKAINNYFTGKGKEND